jgi:hypothetical protein
MNVANPISSRAPVRWRALAALPLLFGLFTSLGWFAGDLPAFAASPPTVTSVEPNRGPEGGGTEVTISGTEFTVASAVEFGGKPAASFNVDSPTSITATSPAGTATVDVTVTTPGGTSVTGTPDLFTYVPPPTITAVVPSEGPEAGGTAVTITGTNLTGATAVKFGSGEATSITVNPEGTQLTATSPAGKGTVDVTVTTPGGTTATASLDHFVYAPPAIVVVPPPSGSPPIVVAPPSPAPVPKKGAVVCTLKVDHVHLPERTRSRRPKTKPRAGTLTVIMNCDQAARVTLSGKLIEPLGKKPKHGKQHTRRVRFGLATASVKAGVPKALTLRLPKPAVTGLEHKKAQKIVFTIVTSPVTAAG